jgi:hypothetical protein
LTLAEGAAKLPLSHLSVRTAWHDTDWTGRVCSAPGANHACTILKNVKERKDAEAEQAVAGKDWSVLRQPELPPCLFERAGFMRPTAYTVVRKHPYSHNKSYSHFKESPFRMGSYSLDATPFRWMMREEAKKYAAEWGIDYDEAREHHVDELTGWKATWVLDSRNQHALLDSFFSSAEPGRSLALVYVKDLPLVEDRPAGFRALVGAGVVESLSPAQEWEHTSEGELRSVFWERGVGHSIRPGFE